MAVVASTAGAGDHGYPCCSWHSWRYSAFSLRFAAIECCTASVRSKDKAPASLTGSEAVLALLCSAALIVMGSRAAHARMGALSMVAMVFGVVGVVLSASDLGSSFIRRRTRISGGTRTGRHDRFYIAAVTAFSVVNFRFLPIAVRWLWPTRSGSRVFSFGSPITKKIRTYGEARGCVTKRRALHVQYICGHPGLHFALCNERV